ncbi:hypothetical protein ACPOL_7165 (plasmid) [Acidisarcina polymorpha]|uniref:Uncharacterized protein n=1 Tax=Acidisarcina polymorpha TaxID=2211140 RepID=A0A2Z5GC37_9BACT|nr:hypothetical protein ACPOL_7165 [Acidisarcina polymorpha]
MTVPNPALPRVVFGPKYWCVEEIECLRSKLDIQAVFQELSVLE